MPWRRIGRVFCAAGQRPWMRTHAANPVAEPLSGDAFRFYFSARDAGDRSSVGFVDVDLKRPREILRISPRPVVSPGELGTFDDSGASMACLVRDGRRTLLYYLGWNLGVTVPWRNSIGLAVRAGAGSTFKRFSPAPLLDRSAVDPYSLSYPWVLREGRRWRMWYGSNLSWGPEQKDMAHVLKYAESRDGVSWSREGRVAVGFKSRGEYALSKPCVARDAGLYRMWYSYRGAAYRIGYAESKDGLAWTRRDEKAGIAPSGSGWDGRAVCYPCVFDHRGRRYLAYNGDDYGRTGFGLAVWERE